VRELINVLERAIIMSSGTLTPDLIELFEFDSDDDVGNLENYEKRYIKKVLRECLGNKRKTAHKLGISIATLYRKLDADDME
jgi:DNA-binding NtrC family response regulator